MLDLSSQEGPIREESSQGGIYEGFGLGVLDAIYLGGRCVL